MARVKGQAEVEKKNKALGELKIEYLEPSLISPNPWNPNRQSEHDFSLLLKSMSEDGFTQPIVVMQVDQESLEKDEALRSAGYEVGQIVIVDGEHRWRAGQELGFEKVPVVQVPMNVAQARIATLRHNRARGSEDIELSAQVLRDLQELGAMDWAQDSLMISDAEVNRLLDDVPAPEALANPDFGEAWTPQKGEQAEDANLSDRRASSTAAAVEARRRAEQQMKEAHSEEERQAIKRDAKVYRFALTFADEEAAIVKAVITEAPAPTVLLLCRKYLEEQGALDTILEKKQEVLNGELAATPEEVKPEDEVPV